MGLCEIKANNANNVSCNNSPQITISPDITKDFKFEKKREAVFSGIGLSIPKEKLKIIKNQREKCICKILNKKSIGTGFLCNIGEFKKIKSLVTAYHVLGEEDLKIGNEIIITFDDDNDRLKIIKIDGKRNIYASEKDDITIIEILDKDKLKDYNELEIDERIFDVYIDFYREYKNKIIYTLHYPEGNISSFSQNKIIDIDINNNIYHFCSTEFGSSGAPILNLDTLKVIGVHQGYNYFDKEKFHNEVFIKYKSDLNKDNKLKCNVGKIIKESIYNYNKENKIILSLKINKYDIDYYNIDEKKIYFIQNYDDFKSRHHYSYGKIKDIKNTDKENHKINIKNFIIYINDKRYEHKNYFIPSKVGIYHIKIFIKNNIQDLFGLFYGCDKIINIDLSSFDTKYVTNMSFMFSNCENLEKINLSSFDTKSVTNMSHMFENCEKLKNIDLSSFDTKNVTNMSFMFFGCSLLTKLDLSSFDTKNVTDMSYMFYWSNNLEAINLLSFDTKNVTDMSFLFFACHNLKYFNLSSFNTKNVINMSYTFCACKSLTNINLYSFDTKNVTDMEEMFSNCENLISLNLSSFDTKNVTNMINMFYLCFSLENSNVQYNKNDSKILNQLNN